MWVLLYFSWWNFTLYCFQPQKLPLLLQKLFHPWCCYVRTHFCTEHLCTELPYCWWDRLQVAALWCYAVNITACNSTLRCWLTHLINTVSATRLHVVALCSGSAPELCVGVGVGEFADHVTSSTVRESANNAPCGILLYKLKFISSTEHIQHFITQSVQMSHW